MEGLTVKVYRFKFLKSFINFTYENTTRKNSLDNNYENGGKY